MARIAVAPLLETGHISASLRLAEALRGSGHELEEWVAEDFRGLVEQEGFAVRTFAVVRSPLRARTTFSYTRTIIGTPRMGVSALPGNRSDA